MVYSNWKKLVGVAAFIISISGGKVLAACTGGPGWTSEDFAEYLKLNDTTGWAGIAKLRHCTLDDLEEEAVLDAASGALESRSGDNAWEGWSGSDCTGQKIGRVTNFGCGICFTGSNFIYGGWLWRQYTGSPYPTADYFTVAGCQGSKLHHQGIFTGQHTSCDGITRAPSAILYQGC
jgi:hypothetical protein